MAKRKTWVEMCERGHWIAVPNWIAWDARLTTTERMLLILLISMSNPIRDGKYIVCPSNRLLAEALGCTPRHVVRMISDLECGKLDASGKATRTWLIDRMVGGEPGNEITDGRALELNWEALNLEDPEQLQERSKEEGFRKRA